MSSTVFMIVGRRSRGIVVIVVMVLMVASLESSRVESVSISLSRTQVFPRPAGHQKKSKRHQKCRSVGRSVECSRPNLYFRFRAASTNYNRHEEVLKRHPPRASQRSVPYRWNPARRLHTPSLPPLGTPRLSLPSRARRRRRRRRRFALLDSGSARCWRGLAAPLRPAPRLQSRTHTTHMELVRISTAGGH